VIVACGGQLYKVAPLPSVAPPDLPSENRNSVGLGVEVLDGDQSLERFEANLPLAGVIALDVRVSNNTAASVNPGSLKFELRDATGAKLKQLSPKKALKCVMDFYGNSFYVKSAYRRTLADYESLSLKSGGMIASNQEHRGIIFFRSRRDSVDLSGMSISVTGIPEPLKVQFKTPGR
jgi:hypothetical protein